MKTLEFNVCSAYLPYLINGDSSALEQYEIDGLDDFVRDLKEVGYIVTNGDIDNPQRLELKHFSTKPEEETFFATCEFCDLKADCLTLIAHYG